MSARLSRISQCHGKYHREPHRQMLRRTMGRQSICWSRPFFYTAMATEDSDWTRTAHAATDKAYLAFTDAMEKELGRTLQVEHTVPGRRGRLPRTKLEPASLHPRKWHQDTDREEEKQWRRLLHAAFLLKSHLMQHLSRTPRKVDDCTLADFTRNLFENGDTTNDMHAVVWRWLASLAESIGADHAAGLLGETRAVAASMLEEKIAHIKKDMSEAASAARSKASKKWKSWARQAADTGARAAHRWAKLPVQFQTPGIAGQEEDNAAEPCLSTVPAAVVEREAKRYAGLWEATDVSKEPSWIKNPGLLSYTPITADTLSATARSFGTNTVESFDGFHVVHFGFLGETGAKIFEQLVRIILCQGRMPGPLRAILSILLPKATTGYRSIALFPSMYRVILRGFRPDMTQWQAHKQYPHFSFSAGKSVVKTVFMQAAEAELAARAKCYHAAIMWDMSDFYERISRAKLAERHANEDFPKLVADLSLDMYGTKRYLRQDTAVILVGCPSRGIAAGCAAATFHVAAYTGEKANNWADAFHQLGLNLHIDDIIMYGTHADKNYLIRSLAKGAVEMEKVVEHEFESKIALKKVATVASHNCVNRQLGKMLGILAGDTGKSAPNLGIDHTAGQQRRHTKGGMSAKRWKKQAARHKKLKILARAHRPTADKVFRTGVVPSISFGAQIWGASPQQIDAWQKYYVAAVCGKAGKSRTLTLLFHSDPVWNAAVAPILTFAALAWDAAMGASYVTFAFLRDFWQCMVGGLSPQKWYQIRGPVGAMQLSLSRIGWKATAKFLCFVDRTEQEHCLLEIGPKMLASLCKRDWHHMLAEKAANKMGMPAGERPDAHHLRSILIGNGPKHKDLPEPAGGRAPGHKEDCKCARCVDYEKKVEDAKEWRKQRGLAISFVLGGVWDKQRIYEAGYLIDDLTCELCGGMDTLHHRLWECTGTEEVRNRMLTKAEQNWLQPCAQHDHKHDQEAMRKWLALKGWARHPAAGQPKPAQGGNQCMGSMQEIFTKQVVATDGHCSKLFHPSLNRASWSAIGIDFVDGGTEVEDIATLTGPVWARLPQTSAAAERVAVHAALNMADQHAIEDAFEIKIDNLGALNGLVRPVPWQQLRASFYAGLQRSMRATETFQNKVATGKHITSHLKEKSPEIVANASLELKREIEANEKADEAATQAEAQHPPLDKELIKKDAWAAQVATKVAKYAGVALALFSAAGHHERAPKGERRERRRRAEERGCELRVAHRWVEIVGPKKFKWRCQDCWSWAASPSSHRGDCAGHPTGFDTLAVAAPRAGHALILMQPLGPLHPRIALCTKCGAMCSQGAEPARLLTTCVRHFTYTQYKT